MNYYLWDISGNTFVDLLYLLGHLVVIHVIESTSNNNRFAAHHLSMLILPCHNTYFTKVATKKKSAYWSQYILFNTIQTRLAYRFYLRDVTVRGVHTWSGQVHPLSQNIMASFWDGQHYYPRINHIMDQTWFSRGSVYPRFSGWRC